jgi:predicted PurR-regulated permease PerM
MNGELRESALVRALLLPLVILAWLAVAIIVVWLVSHLVHTLLIVILGAIVAFALTPLVDLLSRVMPRLIAIALGYVIGFAFVIGLLSVVVASAAGEVTTLAHNLPGYARMAQDWEQNTAPGLLKGLGLSQSTLNNAQDRLISYLQGISTDVATGAVDFVRTVLGAIIDTVLILILSVYLVANAPRLVAWMRTQAPAGQGRRAGVLIAIVNQVVGGYVRGTLTMALLIGLLVFAGMGFLDVPFPLLLGIVAFFMEFIPVLGVFISGALCVLIALFSHGWLLALVVLGYFVIVHVIEGDLIGPRVMASAVGIHPAVALLALVAGSELFGVWGALFGAPIAGLLQAIVRAAYREVRVSRIQEATDIEVPAGHRHVAEEGSGLN